MYIMHIYIYIYVFVCVCVCVYLKASYKIYIDEPAHSEHLRPKYTGSLRPHTLVVQGLIH